MKPFNRTQTCPKCLNEHFNIRHSSTRSVCLDQDNYLTYACSNCGYSFLTACADASRPGLTKAQINGYNEQITAALTEADHALIDRQDSYSPPANLGFTRQPLDADEVIL